LGRGFVGLLDTLFLEEVAAAGTLITASVTNRQSGIPSRRFYRKAEGVGMSATT
jgi:hypothetical protein